MVKGAANGTEKKEKEKRVPKGEEERYCKKMGPLRRRYYLQQPHSPIKSCFVHVPFCGIRESALGEGHHLFTDLCLDQDVFWRIPS